MRALFAVLLLTVAFAGCSDAPEGDAEGDGSSDSGSESGTGTASSTRANTQTSATSSTSSSSSTNSTPVPIPTNQTGNATAGNQTGNATAGNQTLGPEVMYVHAEDLGTEYINHEPAGGEEAAHGLAGLASSGYSYSDVATEPTVVEHPAGTTVELHIQGFTLVPAPQVTASADIKLGGAVVGSGTSSPANSVSVALVTTPCTDWVITFTTTQDIPAGSVLLVSASIDAPVQTAACYPGGEDGPRIVFGAQA